VVHAVQILRFFCEVFSIKVTENIDGRMEHILCTKQLGRNKEVVRNKKYIKEIVVLGVRKGTHFLTALVSVNL